MFDQAEIDALLSSVEAQNAPADDGSIQIFSRHRRDSEPVEIREYDFRRPERIRKEELRAMETLHEAFARNLGASLTSFLRAITEVSIAQIEQMTYAEFIGGLPNPTSYTLLESPALEGSLGLELSPLIIYPIIDRLLGGGGASDELYIPQRPLTAIEARLVRQILTRAASALTDAWKEIAKATFTLGDMETNPLLVQFVPPDELVVVVRFELRMSKRAGGMALCIPSKVMDGVVEKLSARNWFGPASGAAQGGAWQPVIAARLNEAAVNLTAILAETSITVREMQHLEVGDVIVSSKEAHEPVMLCVEGRPKFLARAGQHRGQRAVEVISPQSPGRHAEA